MLMAFQITALLLSCILVIVLVYRGMNLPCAILIGCLCIILTNGLNLTETVSAMMTEVGSMATSLMLPYLLGAIMAKVLLDTGCVKRLAFGLLDLFAKGRSRKVRYVVAMTIALVVNALLAYLNLNNPLIQGAIVVGMCVAADIPRRYLPVLCMLGSTVGTLFPGSVLVNLFAGAYFQGSSSFDGWPVLLIVSLFVLCAGILITYRSICKDTAAGMKFDYGPLPTGGEEGEGEKHLPWWCGIFPFAAILIPYIAFGCEAWLSILIGLVVTLVLYFRELPRVTEGKQLTGAGAVQNALNTGYTLAGMPTLMLFNNALAAAIAATAAFTVISDWFASLPFAPLVNLGILGSILTGISSGPSGYLLGCSVAVSTYVPAGVSAAACRCVMIASYTVLDTLPTNMAFLVLASWSGTTVKESYPPVLKATVLVTAVGVALTIALCLLFPGMAVTM